ncbi:MAG: hypothetical protein FVQ82_02060 [Planctomycetes bacterium]|nr:hypothetical protein [Planctomycetota bacterium]
MIDQKIKCKNQNDKLKIKNIYLAQSDYWQLMHLFYGFLATEEKEKTREIRETLFLSLWPSYYIIF